jgi:hypothetical protein
LVVLEVACAVLLPESFNSTGRIHEFLLAGIERMAHRADFCVDFLGRTASLERVATAAMNHYLIIFWMYFFFHDYLPALPNRYRKTLDYTDRVRIFKINFRKTSYFAEKLREILNTGLFYSDI